MVTRWSPSGHQVVTTWSPSGHQVDIKWSPSGQEVVTGPIINLVQQEFPKFDFCEKV